MTDRVRVALVGCGHMGAHHARVTAQSARSRLAVVVDLHPDRARAFADRWGAVAEPTVPREIDAVVVATPTTTHVAVARPLVERGQWCLVEKPLAPTAREASELRTDRLVVGHSERFNPAIRALGGMRPVEVDARRVTRRSQRGRDVDVLADLMIHDLDLLGWWSEPGSRPVVDHASGARGPDGSWDRATAEVRLGSLRATLEACRDGEPAREIVLRDRARVAHLDLLAGRARDEEGDLPPRDPRDALEAQWDAFLDAVEGTASAAVGLGDSLAALALAERIRDALEAT